jgi:hypothetical protein
VKVTLRIDDEVVKRARESARQRGTTLNQLIHDYLTELAADRTDELIGELEHLWATSGGNSEGRRWTREEIHDRSRFR